MTKTRNGRRPKRTPPRKSEAFDTEKLIAALFETRGNIAGAARRLGMKRANTIRDYARRHPKVRAAVEESRAMVIDDAENALHEAVDRGEAWAVCFTLKCLAKDRGYIEHPRLEVTGPDGGPILHNHTIDVRELSTKTLRLIVAEVNNGSGPPLLIEGEAEEV